MSDPMTPEGRAELRAVAEAVGKRAHWNWDGIEGKFFVHESAWNVAEISCGSYDRSSDEERVNVERRIARFIAAADPETVCKLLDALDKAEQKASDRFDAAVRHRLRAMGAETALERVRELTYASDDGTEYDHNGPAAVCGEPECPACWATAIRRALDGTS